jgi:hypothetical protein
LTLLFTDPYAEKANHIWVQWQSKAISNEAIVLPAVIFPLILGLTLISMPVSGVEEDISSPEKGVIHGQWVTADDSGDFPLPTTTRKREEWTSEFLVVAST